MMERQSLEISTHGRAIIEFTSKIEALLRASSMTQGLCHLFLHHTSASLLITENADQNVLVDLENYFARIVKDGDPAYFHDQEGPDDMAAHIRSALTQTELTVPFEAGRLLLGTWQGLFLWEHRLRPHHRRITVTFTGEQS